MVSEYEYATVASLELYTSEDYGAIDATLLADDEVYAKITAAEWLINTYLGTSFTGTIPDGVIFATHDITKRLLYKWMRENGMMLDKQQVLEADKALISEDIKMLLNTYKGSSTPIKLHRFYNNNPGVFY